MRYTVRPLSDRTWLRPAAARQPSRFDSTWTSTLEVLAREIDRLDGRNVVIEVDVPERGIRQDGQLRADAKATSPAVVLAFDSTHGPMHYRCDRFTSPTWRGGSPDWQQNVRAIALTLESLRAVNRYGAVDTGQQYAGFKAIGGGTPIATEPPTMGAPEALRVIYDLTGLRLEGDPLAETTRRAWRQARAAVHPDRHDNDHGRWDLVERAGRALGLTS